MMNVLQYDLELGQNPCVDDSDYADLSVSAAVSHPWHRIGVGKRIMEVSRGE
ncbi:hypothetical protein J31TS3_23510 [Paenibacillus lactis]|nr:hypothetical protein J31TS3_23510 [Paenibacillus lactis]